MEKQKCGYSGGVLMIGEGLTGCVKVCDRLSFCCMDDEKGHPAQVMVA